MTEDRAILVREIERIGYRLLAVCQLAQDGLLTPEEANILLSVLRERRERLQGQLLSPPTIVVD